MVITGNWTNTADLLSDVGKGHFVFSLTGRFGNQLLGMSDAKLIARLSRRRPILYFGNGVLTPRWIDELVDCNWFDILHSDFMEEDVNQTDVGQIIDFRQESLVNSFMGFSTSIYRHRESGFLTTSDPIFAQEKETEVASLVISVRRGDYLLNPNLGELSFQFYRRALRRMISEFGPFQRIHVCVDNQALARRLKKTWFSDLGEVRHSLDPLDDWKFIRCADYAISANSTFSYTARLGKMKETAFPDPFYLVHRNNFLDESCLKISHTAFPQARYFYLRMKAKLAIHQMNKSSKN